VRELPCPLTVHEFEDRVIHGILETSARYVDRADWRLVEGIVASFRARALGAPPK